MFSCARSHFISQFRNTVSTFFNELLLHLLHLIDLNVVHLTTLKATTFCSHTEPSLTYLYICMIEFETNVKIARVMKLMLIKGERDSKTVKGERWLICHSKGKLSFLSQI